MSDFEKINIYVPHGIGLQLQNDAFLFEIFKKGKYKTNMNRFLTMLICGYYDSYLQENKKIHDKIQDILMTSSLPAVDCSDLATAILKEVVLPSIPKRKGKKPICLSFKPTAETERIMCDIESQLNETDVISQFLCRMLVGYCSKPIYERERIVFKNNYDSLLRFCEDQRAITFLTAKDSKQLHEVIPYAIAVGKEEMFNYLLCEEVNTKTGQPEARSYRLNRIDCIGHGHRMDAMTEEVKVHCEKSLAIAPQYAINSDEKICVRLNDEGEKLYTRIYLGRPIYDNIINSKDGKYHDYYFSCSADQVFHYFRRFTGETAVILSPEFLRNKMIDFHEDAILAYKVSEN